MGAGDPLNGVRHTETVPWQLHLKKVLDCFGGFWRRWMSLDSSGQLWVVAFRKQLQFALAGYGRFWAGSAGLWAAFARSGRLWEALGSVLDASGRVWEALGGALRGPWRGLDGIGRGTGSSSGVDLEGFGRFWRVRKRSGQFWMALDGSGWLGKLWMVAWSFFAACRMSEIMFLPFILLLRHTRTTHLLEMELIPTHSKYSNDVESHELQKLGPVGVFK